MIYRIRRYSEEDPDFVPMMATGVAGGAGIAHIISRREYNKKVKDEIEKAVESSNKVIKSSNKLKEAFNKSHPVKVALDSELKLGRDIKHGFFGTSYKGQNAKNIKKHVNSISEIKKLKNSMRGTGAVALAGLGTLAAHQYYKHKDRNS